MNKLCADISWKSLIHTGEQLCGDRVEIVQHGEDSTVMVLADGLGSGVKANILSTLTSKIISTMLADGLLLEDCVATIAATLPTCSVRHLAYSTFTVVQLVENEVAHIMQYDNPHVIMLRDGQVLEYPKEKLYIGDKKIYSSVIPLQENDIIIAMSDGCPHAGIGHTFSFGWRREEIAEFMSSFVGFGYSADTLATLLVDECNKLYRYEPGDDATACVIRMCKRAPVNVLFGPPKDPKDCETMLSQFFARHGKYVTCGGTTSRLAAEYLGKPLTASLDYDESGIPPVAFIEGVELATEGVITVNRVVEYAKDALGENKLREQWKTQQDAASKMSRLLFDEATDVRFFVGTAINPAHQNPNLPVRYHIKMSLTEELAECLRQMGKRVSIRYF